MNPYLRTFLDGTYCQPVYIGNLDACKDQGQASSDQGVPRHLNPYAKHSAENRWWDFGWTNSLTELCGE